MSNHTSNNKFGDKSVIDYEPGNNANVVKYLRRVEKLNGYEPKTDYDIRFDKYLDLCEEMDRRVTNLTAYLAFGINHQTAYQWENKISNGVSGANQSESAQAKCDIIKRVKFFCGGYRADMAANNRIYPNIAIFEMKNFDGLKDVQDVAVTSTNPLREAKTDEEIDAIRAKYLPPADD